MTTLTPRPLSLPTAVGVTMPSTSGRTSVVDGQGIVVLVTVPDAVFP